MMKNMILTLFNPDNDFFNLTKDSKRITHIWLSSFILPVVFLYVAAVMTQNIFIPLFFGDPTLFSHSAREAFGLYFMFGTTILFIFLWVKFYEGRPIYTLGFTKNSGLKRYLFGFATGIFLNTLVIGIMALIGSIEISPEYSFSIGNNQLIMIIIFFFGYIIQGSSEEILIRGWMFQVIGSRYKPWIGVLITSLFFAFAHLANSGINIFATINIFMIALLFTLYVMRDGSLWFVCGWHSAWNWSLGNVYGLSVSGKNEVPSIIDLNTTGNVIFSGGDFGPEGSVIVTIIFIIPIFLVSSKIIKSQKTNSISSSTSLY
jgi:membrane protease YdiL (CAAX protease family)